LAFVFIKFSEKKNGEDEAVNKLEKSERKHTLDLSIRPWLLFFDSIPLLFVDFCILFCVLVS
jgi:hypothetical protein